MAGGGSVSAPTESMTVATLCDLFLDFSEATHTPEVFENYKLFLDVFCRQLGMLAANAIKPLHVNRWLDGHPGGRTTHAYEPRFSG